MWSGHGKGEVLIGGGGRVCGGSDGTPQLGSVGCRHH